MARLWPLPLRFTPGRRSLADRIDRQTSCPKATRRPSLGAKEEH